MRFPIQTPAPGIDAGDRPVRVRASALAVVAVLVASAALAVPVAAYAEGLPAQDLQAVAAEAPASVAAEAPAPDAVEAPVEQPTDAAVEPVAAANEEPPIEQPPVEESAAEEPPVEQPAPAAKSFVAASGPEALAAPAGPAEAGPGEPVNQPPVAVDDHYVVEQGVVLQVAAPGAMANDFDPDGDQMAFVHTNGALTGTFGWYTGLWMTYEPAPGFLGTDSTQYRITDGQGGYSNWATITFEVVATDGVENHPPVPVGETVTMFTGTTHVAAAPGVLANDVDVDGDQLFILMKPKAANGEFAMTADGAWTFTPDAGFVGNVHVDYSVTDGSVYASARLTIVVVEPPAGEESAEPGAPIEPEESTGPMEPGEPTGPVEPGEPTESGEPTEPGRPAEEQTPLDENEPSDAAVRTETATSDAAALAATGSDVSAYTTLAAFLVALGIALRLRRRAADH